jgi:hypothetical protein
MIPHQPSHRQSDVAPAATGGFDRPAHWRCAHCGRLGVERQDVVWDWEYVGGRGYQGSWLCLNRSDCWRRWDWQHLAGVIR